MHLRSDVSVGLALSGGLDSSAIACAVRHLNPNQEINTFSFIDDTGYKNEANWIDIINNKVNAKSSSIVISSKELANDLDKMIIRQGEPFGSTTAFFEEKVNSTSLLLESSLVSTAFGTLNLTSILEFIFR